MIESLEERLGREEPQPGGGQLERQRQAVEAPAHGRDGPGILGRQLERAPGRSSAFDEQRDCGILDQRLDRARVRRWRELEWSERVLALHGDPQRCPAGGDDPQSGAALDQAGHL